MLVGSRGRGLGRVVERGLNSERVEAEDHGELAGSVEEVLMGSVEKRLRSGFSVLRKSQLAKCHVEAVRQNVFPRE